jgi:hypothetical protein
MGDQPVTMPLSTHRTTQTQNECTQTYTPQARFEPTISVFELEKTVHALDRKATVIGPRKYTPMKKNSLRFYAIFSVV